MNILDLSNPLPINKIDFRVQSVNRGGYAVILAYKDARVDQQRLDDVVGPLRWKREHTNNNRNCIVSIWCEDKKQWVSKEDTGTESNAEKEKGLASDSFKRACFNWGIGRELYEYPQLSVKLRDDEWVPASSKNETPRASWKLRPNSWIWCSQFDEDKRLSYLACKDDFGLRFTWGTFKGEDSK